MWGYIMFQTKLIIITHLSSLTILKDPWIEQLSELLFLIRRFWQLKNAVGIQMSETVHHIIICFIRSFS